MHKTKKEFLARRSWILWSLLAGLITVAWDVVTTIYALSRGATEQNPFFYIVGPQLVLLALIVQPLLSAVVAYGSQHINQHSDRAFLAWPGVVIAFNAPRLLVGLLNLAA